MRLAPIKPLKRLWCTGQPRMCFPNSRLSASETLRLIDVPFVRPIHTVQIPDGVAAESVEAARKGNDADLPEPYMAIMWEPAVGALPFADVEIYRRDSSAISGLP